MPGSALLAALRAMLPVGAAAGWADLAVDHPLMAGEAVPGAVPLRRREFAAGRAAARMALAQLGLGGLAIPHGEDRAPVWPAGFTGSITHTRQVCLAVAVPLVLCRGIGIDLEDDSPLPAELWETVLRPDEQAGMTGTAAKAVFCAKEAAFKAQYPASRTLYGFDGMRVRVTGARFRAEFTTAVPPFTLGDAVEGQIAWVAGHVLALARLSAPQRSDDLSRQGGNSR